MAQKTISLVIAALVALAFIAGCNRAEEKKPLSHEDSLMLAKVNKFAVVKLTTDLSKLTEKEKQMIPLLIEAADLVDAIYWTQTIAEKDTFLNSIPDSLTRKFAAINYGPWERLEGNLPFIKGYGEKPAGANFYPPDMTKEEFEKFDGKDKTSLYTLIARNADSTLKQVWYHEAYAERLQKASQLLKEASKLAEDPGLRSYLDLCADALLSDDYFASDMAWMDMKTNTIDIVIGPIENYEDELFGYKAAYEAAIVVKDKEWSQKLSKFSAMLPMLQKQLPVDEKYKKETPGSDSDLNAYDIIYCAGQANEGSKTIAINLPNDEKVQLAKGSRRLQLKNAMKAKFDNILAPIAGVVIDSSQRGYVKFDAFFSNVMFHEVAHGLGIKNTVDGKGTVREALKEKYSSFEEAKADILGLFMVTKLIETGELPEITKEEAFVTYMAGLIRSVRFGAASAHGKANMMCFNFFAENGAFVRDPIGTYRVDFDKFRLAMNDWAKKVLMFEGDGDYEGAKAYLEANGKILPNLQSDIDKISESKIPVDIIYDQGLQALGL
jgi:hypothetical protein